MRIGDAQGDFARGDHKMVQVRRKSHCQAADPETQVLKLELQAHQSKICRAQFTSLEFRSWCHKECLSGVLRSYVEERVVLSRITRVMQTPGGSRRKQSRTDLIGWWHKDIFRLVIVGTETLNCRHSWRN